jgi:hypothetical protein
MVVTTNNAWSRLLNGAILSGGRVQRHRASGRLIEYRVVGHGNFPVDGSAVANTLIMDEETETFIAINDCNLQESLADIGVCFVVRGRDVTAKLSAESKKAVLEAHLGAGQ